LFWPRRSRSDARLPADAEPPSTALAPLAPLPPSGFGMLPAWVMGTAGEVGTGALLFTLAPSPTESHCGTALARSTILTVPVSLSGTSAGLPRRGAGSAPPQHPPGLSKVKEAAGSNGGVVLMSQGPKTP